MAISPRRSIALCAISIREKFSLNVSYLTLLDRLLKRCCFEGGRIGVQRKGKHMRYGTSTAISLAAAALIGAGAIAPVQARVIETVLLEFTMGRDGSIPSAGLVVGSNGRIYGATAYNYPPDITLPACVGNRPPACGNVFELTPPAAGKTGWTERVLAEIQPSFDVDSLLIVNSPTAEMGIYGTATTACSSACVSTVGTIFGIAQGQGLKTLQKFYSGGFTTYVEGPGLISNAAGALYGTTSFSTNVLPPAGPSGSTIFKLMPPAVGGDAWKLTTLWSFVREDGGLYIMGPLLADTTGALYGITSADTIFKLTPPAAGKTKWTLTTLWRASGSEQLCFASGLVADATGALYGIMDTCNYSRNNSMVFKLTPPAAGKIDWTLTTLWNFTDGSNPGSVIIDRHGALYGTAGTASGGNGIIFTLTPPAAVGGHWTETVLYSFTGGKDGGFPNAALAADKNGVLYGTTIRGGALTNPTCLKYAGLGGCGVVFQLTGTGFVPR
jgi:hypothetical protein